jgi:hypothetical protein
VEMKRPMRVVHTQSDGMDTVKIYTPAHPDHLYYSMGEWPLEDGVTAFESAVQTLWGGYGEAMKYSDTFESDGVIVSSNVVGAADQWGKEFDVEE